MRDIGFMRPNPGATTQAVTGAASARTKLKAGEHVVLRLYSPVDCFVAFGDSTVVASATTDMRIVGGIPEYVTIQDGDTYIAYILASGASTLDITPLT